MNKKLVLIIISAVLAIAVIATGIVVLVSSGDGNDTTGTTASAQTGGTSQEAEGGTSQTQTTEADTTSDISRLILGSWRDSVNMSGYKFYEDGTVEMTYVNLTVPVINLPINGTSTGVYTLEGNTLTTTFSIYSASIVNTYTVSVENNMLTMKNHEDSETATYSRYTEAEQEGGIQIGDADDVSDYLTDIAGSWVNDDASVRYGFNKDGSATVTKKDQTYSGVYVVSEQEIIIQYTVLSQKITEEYSYTVSGNSLVFRNDEETTVLIRSGTSALAGNETGLIGIWRDGANMSGYEFKEGGIVNITYVNFTVPVINMPINGTFAGSYSVEDGRLIISYSIYGNSVSESYEYTISENSLTLTDGDGKISTYVKK